MFSMVAPLLAAALLAATPQEGANVDAEASPGDAMAGIIPSQQLQDVVVDALPKPPDRVLRVTKYYGTVTVNHRAHLARRAKCAGCHDPGPITKLTFTPKVAHERCVGCHREEKKGPTDCKACHIKSDPPPGAAPVQMAAVAPGQLEPQAAPGPNPANLAAAFSATDPSLTPGSTFGREAFGRWFEIGFNATNRAQGLAVRFASHQDRILVTQSVDAMRSDVDARTIALLGAGVSAPLHSGVGLELLGLGGVDVVDRPLLAFLPAVGARVGLQWRPHVRFIQSLTASVTGIRDLASRSVPGKAIESNTIYGSIGTGFAFPSK